MKLKKLTVVLASLSLVISGFAGISVRTQPASAEETNEEEKPLSVQLPTIAGLYVAEYFDCDDTGKVQTGTDASGNTVLVNGEGEWIHYQAQERPDYLIYGIKEGWGMDFENNDEKWFDYVSEKGEVTHVAPSDLVITHLDGTPCDHITVTAKESDDRVAVFHVEKLENVKISYKGATTNNALIGAFTVRIGFYTSETMSLESQITREANVVKEKTKDFYFHMTDTWEEAGFRFDAETGVEIRYWDDAKQENIWVSGNDAKEFVTLSPVSINDPHHLIYKLTANGITKADSSDYEIKISFTKYNTKDESESYEEDRNLNIKITEANTLYTAESSDLMVKGGKYTYLENAYFTKNIWYGAGNTTNAVYMLFQYSDAEGNLKPVTDFSKLTFWHGEWIEEQEKDVYEKIADGVLKVEKAYADSDLVKISYLGEAKDFGNEYTITYDGASPAGHGNQIDIAFTPAVFNELSTYSSKEISDDVYANEFKTDGTADVEIYAASVDTSKKTPWNIINSIEIKEIHLTDEEGDDLSSEIKRDNSITLTEKTGQKILFNEKITIPKGTLSSSAKMRIEFIVHGTGGDGKTYEDQKRTDVFLFYSEPAKKPAEDKTKTPSKGTKATVGGAVYTVTGKGTASFTTGKKNAKTVTVPDSVKISGVSHKVTAVAAKACKGNTKLTKLTIGKNVTSIGKNAFDGCKKLKTITIKASSITSIGAKAFASVPKTAKASVPKAKKAAYKKLLKKGGYKGKVK